MWNVHVNNTTIWQKKLKIHKLKLSYKIQPRVAAFTLNNFFIYDHSLKISSNIVDRNNHKINKIK